MKCLNYAILARIPVRVPPPHSDQSRGDLSSTFIPSSHVCAPLPACALIINLLQFVVPVIRHCKKYYCISAAIIFKCVKSPFQPCTWMAALHDHFVFFVVHVFFIRLARAKISAARRSRNVPLLPSRSLRKTDAASRLKKYESI